MNADNTKYMVMSRDQNIGSRQNINFNNSSFERVEEIKYLGKTLTYQNSVQEEIKSRLQTGNAYYHPVPNLLPSSLVSRNTKIKIHRTIILPVVFMWV